MRRGRRRNGQACPLPHREIRVAAVRAKYRRAAAAARAWRRQLGLEARQFGAEPSIIGVRRGGACDARVQLSSELLEFGGSLLLDMLELLGMRLLLLLEVADEGIHLRGKGFRRGDLAPEPFVFFLEARGLAAPTGKLRLQRLHAGRKVRVWLGLVRRFRRRCRRLRGGARRR